MHAWGASTHVHLEQSCAVTVQCGTCKQHAKQSMTLPACHHCAQPLQGLDGGVQGPVLEVLGSLRAAAAAVERQGAMLAASQDRSVQVGTACVWTSDGTCLRAWG